MRGWSSVLVGIMLLGLAYWSFSNDGFGSSTLFCGAAAVFLVFRGAQGLAVGETGDPTALFEFVANPAGAIVDTATERLNDWIDEPEPAARTTAAAPAEELQPAFDADAVLARYLEKRVAEPASARDSVPPFRGFGRKGA